MKLLNIRKSSFFFLIIISLLIFASCTSSKDSSSKNLNQNNPASNTQAGVTPKNNTTGRPATPEIKSADSDTVQNESSDSDTVQNKSADSDTVQNESADNDAIQNESIDNESAKNKTTDKEVKEITSSNIDSDKDLNDADNTKQMIAIDAGHQSKGNYEKEPIGPGSKTKKAKVSSGTQGVSSGVPEYKFNLTIALKVKEELLDRGYEVFMIRETNDVDLSNKERADLAADSGSDLFLRIHANGSDNSSVKGVSTLYPSKDNPYVSDLSTDSRELSESIVDAICEQTGAKNRGASANDTMSGINWSTIPVTIIEVGFMSNPKEDKAMQTKSYQRKIVNGICDGIDDYYENQKK
ncbi:MAG: N-acetylmuramoyl-L-alanine amidase [Mobilitalea sp.]